MGIGDISPEELQAALGITAQISADVFSDPATTEQARLRAIGDYFICCCLGSVSTREELQDSFEQGLHGAGVDPSVAARLGDVVSSVSMQRRIGSLSHIPKDETVPGIRYSRRGVTLDEPDFVRGIVARGYTY